MAIKLASLFFEIAAKSDKLVAELKKGEKSTKAWAKESTAAAERVKDGFATVTAGFVTYKAALTAVYITTASNVAEQQKLATRLDTTYGNLKLLSVAAKAAAVDQEGINDTLADFTERLGEARIDGGEPAEALTMLRLSAQELADMDPADALRQVLKAMEELPDAGVRAATGAKLFGDEGIKITGLLAEQFDMAEQKIESLGGALTDLEATQITEATAAVGDLGLVADLARDKFTARLAPAVSIVSKQLFESAKQGEQLDNVLDRLTLSALNGFASVATVAGGALRFIDGRTELVSYGVLGYMLLGKKGALIGTTIAGLKDSALEMADDMRLRFSGSADSVEILQDKIETLKGVIATKSKDAGLPLIGGFFQNQADDAAAELAATEAELARLTAGVPKYATAIDDTGGVADLAADGFELLAESIREVIENYGKLGEAANDSSLVSPASDWTVPEGYGETGSKGGKDKPEAPTVHLDPADQAYWDGMNSRREEERKALEEQASFRRSYFAGELYAAKQFQQTWTMFEASGAKDRLSILTRETSGALSTLSEHSRTMFELNKAIGLANATVYIAEGIAASWKLGWPMGAVAAATVALEGAAQIKAITSAKFGKGDVTQPGTGSSSGIPDIVTDVSSPNSGAAANDAAVAGGVGTQGGGTTIFAFHSPGATEEQRADEYAQMLQTAQDNDLLVPDGNGGFKYTGTGTSNYVAPAYEAVA